MAKKRMSSILIIGIVLLVIAIVLGIYTTGIGTCVIGSGNVDSETRSVDIFHSAELRGWGNLYITQNGASEISIEAEDNILPLLKTYVTSGKLIIENELLTCIRPTKPVNVYVSMEEVKQLSVSGSGDIIGQTKITSDSLGVAISGSGNIDLDVDAKKLSTSISGSGNAKLKGVATTHDVMFSGSGKIQSYELVTEETTLTISGSGNSEVFASNELDVTISGSGNVYYKGNPANVNTQISGSGKLEKVD